MHTITAQATDLLGRYVLFVDAKPLCLLEPGRPTPLLLRSPCCSDSLRYSPDGPECRRCWGLLRQYGQLHFHASPEEASEWLPSVLVLTHEFYHSVMLGWLMAEALPSLLEELEECVWLSGPALQARLATLELAVDVQAGTSELRS